MVNESSYKSTNHVHGLMLLAMLLASSSFPIGAKITGALDPAIMMFLRFLLAAVLFAPYVFIKNGLVIPSWKSLLRYAALSLPLVVFFWCMFESLRYTSALNTGALYTIVPAITGVYAFFINREKTGKIRTIGLLIGVVGALWINFRGDLNSLIRFEFNRGDLIFLAGCFGIGFYSPLVKRLYRNEPTEVMTFWTLFMGSIWLFFLSGTDLWKVEWSAIKPEVYGGIVYLSFFSTLCTFFLLQYSTIRLGATKTAAYSFLTPVFVLGINVLLGKGNSVVDTLPGIVLVIVAMLIIQREEDQVFPVLASVSR